MAFCFDFFRLPLLQKRTTGALYSFVGFEFCCKKTSKLFPFENLSILKLWLDAITLNWNLIELK